MHVTVDGKTIRPDGTIDWVGEGPEAYDFEAFDRVDTCVLGRVMYTEYEEYWRGVVAGAIPGTPDAKRYAEFADRTPHLVLTHTVTEFNWPVARPVSDVNEIAALRDQPGRDIYVVGGAQTVRSFINAGLLDELRLTVHPCSSARARRCSTAFRATTTSKSPMRSDSTTAASGWCTAGRAS